MKNIPLNASFHIGGYEIFFKNIVIDPMLKLLINDKMKTPITAKDAKERALLNIKPYTKIPDHIFTGIYGAIENGQLETYFMVDSFEVLYIDDLHKLGYTTELKKIDTDKYHTESYIRLTISWK